MNKILDAVEKIIPINRDWASQQIPRCHGNGFLQLDVTKSSRVHIWDPRIPNVRPYSQIHDHRRGFISHILAGEIINREDFILKGNTHFVYHGDHVKHCLVPTNKTVRVSKGPATLYCRNDSYKMLRGGFHESIANHCCTLMVRKYEEPLKISTVLSTCEVETIDYHRLGVDDKLLQQILQDVERML